MDLSHLMISDWHTIETLEVLAHNQDTALDSIILIYSLSQKENPVQTKASHSFVAMYQVVLAETCLSLEERWTLINQIEQDYGVSEVILSALSRGLKSHQFTGSLRSVDDDYHSNQHNPEPGEIANFWNQIIEKLKILALDKENPFSSAAMEVLIFRMQDQLIYGSSQEMVDAISEIVEVDGLSNEIRNKLVPLISERFNVDEDIGIQIKDLLQNYQPTTLEGELSALVVNAPWVNVRTKDGDFIDISKSKAQELATKFIDAKVDWLPHLKLLLTGDQHQTFAFAEQIGMKADNKEEILDYLMAEFEKINQEDQNSAFIMGFLRGSDDDEFTRKGIDLLISNESTILQGVRAVNRIKAINIEDLKKLQGIFQEYPELLSNIEYVDLSNLKINEFIQLIEWVKEINYSFGLQMVWELLRKKNVWSELRDRINEWLWVSDMLSFRSTINTSLHIEDLIMTSLKDDPNPDRIEFLVKQILDEYQDYSMKNEALLHRLVHYLFQDHWDLAWPLFGEFIVTRGNKSTYGLNLFLDRYKFDNKKLYEWSQKDLSYPPIALQYMTIETDDSQGHRVWDPQFLKLIEENRGNTVLQDKLANRFINYSISGISAEKLYEDRKVMLKQLLDTGDQAFNKFLCQLLDRIDKNIEFERIQRENYELDN